MPGRPARRRQDLAGQVGRPRDRPQFRPRPLSLGGVRDEAGNPRTPAHLYRLDAGQGGPVDEEGEIVESAVSPRRGRQAGGSDWRGDPSSALLEVLDPEQNGTFNDHYLEVDYRSVRRAVHYDGQHAAHAAALMDRMEIIRLPGYTEDEKVEIAKRHLLPKQVEAHGLKDHEWSVSDSALRSLIRYYTREAGVRNLEREIANLARKAVKQIVGGASGQSLRHHPECRKICRRVRKFRFGLAEDEDAVGVVTGLAWTEVGGELLSVRSCHPSRQGQGYRDRQAWGRYEGIGPGGREFRGSPARSASASSRPFSRSAISMSMCPKGRRQRTGRRPASP